MYLRSNRRFKNGKEHHYWSIVESKRCTGGKVVQRQVLYLGEISDNQHEAWCRTIEAFDEEAQLPRQLALLYSACWRQALRVIFLHGEFNVFGGPRFSPGSAR